jgi:hypothetical protein
MELADGPSSRADLGIVSTKLDTSTMGASDGFLRTYKGLSNSSSDNSTKGDLKETSPRLIYGSCEILT